VRTATVNATITSSNVGAVSQDVQQRINKLSLPSSATVSLGGVTSSPFAATGSILLMLVGIVVTNAIVLLDLVNQYRAKGLDARSAVIEGGRRRLRPILMTAIATILALVPMAVGLSKAGGFIAGPLAIVVIGGLTTSTILTLLLVPTLYVIVEDIRGRLSRGHTTPPVPPANGEDLESQDTQERTAFA
jgi:HAE1 family hydrophobic/amphiphilic exporter-1